MLISWGSAVQTGLFLCHLGMLNLLHCGRQQRQQLTLQRAMMPCRPALKKLDRDFRNVANVQRFHGSIIMFICHNVCLSPCNACLPGKATVSARPPAPSHSGTQKRRARARLLVNCCQSLRPVQIRRRRSRPKARKAGLTPRRRAGCGTLSHCQLPTAKPRRSQRDAEQDRVSLDPFPFALLCGLCGNSSSDSAHLRPSAVRRLFVCHHEW